MVAGGNDSAILEHEQPQRGGSNRSLPVSVTQLGISYQTGKNADSSKIVSHLHGLDNVNVDRRPIRVTPMPDQSRKLFEVLVRQNEASLITYLRTMVRDPGLADDLFQETLITAWKRFDHYDQSLPLTPWLRGIALNLARNAGRRRQRECLIFGDTVNAAVEDTIQSFEELDGDDWSEK